MTTLREAIMIRFQKSQKLGIKILFPFNYDDLDKVRSLPGRKYHSDGKYWTTPLSVEVVEKLLKWNFDIDKHLKNFLKKTKLHIDQVFDKIKIPGLKHKLYPFQNKGVSFIEKKGGRALITDEMGLGKTMQALAWLQLHPELRPAVIVVPASLKLNWKREAEKWMEHPHIQILSGRYPETMIGQILIINYDILPHWIKALESVTPKVLITDECHYYKNNKAARTKAVKRLGKHIPHVIALSGTPIINRPIEMFNAIHLINPTIAPNRWKFAEQYCGLRHNGFGWDMNGATNTKELHERLSNTIMIRRRKDEVLPDLPEKTRSFIPIELDNDKVYRLAEKDFVSFVARQKGAEAADRASAAEALAEIEGLKQLAVRGKMKQAIEWIRNFLEVDGKLVVFCSHRFVVDVLMEEFSDRAVKVDGSVTGVNRQKAVDRFQNDDNIRLFVGNVKAAGVGITLTAASNVVFLELPWTPGEVTQAEDRVHRIGQRNSVNIHYLLANDTIEEKIAQLIDRKRKVLDAVLDGKRTDTESLLTELMKEYE